MVTVFDLVINRWLPYAPLWSFLAQKNAFQRWSKNYIAINSLPLKCICKDTQGTYHLLKFQGVKKHFSVILVLVLEAWITIYFYSWITGSCQCVLWILIF
jgi:hypothetical protein